MSDYEIQTRWSVPPSFPWEQWSETRGENTSCVIDLRDVSEALREVDLRIEQLRQARERLMRVRQEDAIRNVAWDHSGPYNNEELARQGSYAAERSRLLAWRSRTAAQNRTTSGRTYAEQMAAFHSVVDQLVPPSWMASYPLSRFNAVKKQEDNDFTNRDEGGVV